MSHMTATAAQRNFTTILDTVIRQGDTISIATDDGAAILVSQDEWYGMLETLYLQSIHGMKESILESKAVPLDECLDNVGWDIS
ncbi:MAG: type II toxin-antitoxin system Phd/YefM family antitoxin [Defluviitaleaceae bacterium]|nr:type II toxin-antitoxin system Phd/YefM family antitoxin [Defluviitaleaceae bacterium]